MATKKRVVKKKVAKTKVNVVVNVNSGNRKKVIGRSAPVVMPSVAPPPMIMPSNPHPSINIASPTPSNALTDGHHELIKHLTSSMANLIVRPPETIAPNEPFKSPEGVQGNLNKPTPRRREALLNAAQRRVKKERSSSSSSEEVEHHVEHHQVGYPGQNVGAYMNELTQHQRAVLQRTPPYMRNSLTFQDTPLGSLPSPSVTNRPERRKSASFTAPLETRGNGVYPRFY